MKELIPILVEYIQSRQKPGGQVLWIGHNARSFDVPFLIKEFSRCSIEIPKDWIFMDTLPLARELVKSGGLFLRLTLYVCICVHIIDLLTICSFQDQTVLQKRHCKRFVNTIKFRWLVQRTEPCQMCTRYH